MTQNKKLVLKKVYVTMTITQQMIITNVSCIFHVT